MVIRFPDDDGIMNYDAIAKHAEAGRIAHVILRRYNDPHDSVIASPEVIFAAALAVILDASVEGSAYGDKHVIGHTMAAVRIARSYSL